jgi:hypothetical protein
VSVSDPFESAKSLIDGFEEHIQDFKVADDAYFAENPIIHVVEQNADRTEELHKFRLVKPPPQRLRRIVNRTFKDIRDVLDQSLFAASWVVLGRRPKNIHFPFGDSPANFDKALLSKRYKAIPKELVPCLKSLEPYPTGEGYTGGNDILKALNVLVQPAKHEILLSVGPGGIRYGLDRMTGPGSLWGPMPFGAAQVDGYRVAENEVPVFTRSPLAKHDTNVNAQFTITFGQLEGRAAYFQNMRVIDAIRECMAEATRVYDALKGEAVKIRASRP